VSSLSAGVFSHSQPPWKCAEIIFTGAVTEIRSSRAVKSIACDAPPEAPVHPIRLASTSGRLQRYSRAVRPFHSCRDKDVNPQRAPRRELK